MTRTFPKETWQTISHGISIGSTVKYTKSCFFVKAPLQVTHKMIWNFRYLERTIRQHVLQTWSFLILQLSNLKATVTHQKYAIISNFDFDQLRVELRPYGSFFDEPNSKIINCHVRS